MGGKAPDLVVHVHAGEYDRLHQACAFAASAAALGWKVVLAFYMYALQEVASGALDELGLQEAEGTAGELGAGMEAAGAPAAGELLARARELGDVEVLGCSASAQFWGLRPDQLEAGVVDEVAGITSILRRTEGARMVLYL